ncbi:MAG: hypothetical protein V4469_03125 [Patescibacteria group bacterium]
MIQTQEKIIIKNCSICSKEIKITIKNDQTYTEGGHYFGTLGKDAEYWECDECYEQKPDEK